MPKLYSASTTLSALKRAGFTMVSQRGSHIKLYQRKEDKTFTVIVPKTSRHEQK